MALWQEREVHSQIRLLYCQTAPWWSTQEGWTWASCYHGLSNFWKKIWSNPLPPKISIFLWSLLQEKLPTNTAINSRLHHISPDCLFCGAKESLRRIFFDCPRAMRIWFGSPLGLRNFTLPNSPPTALLLQFLAAVSLGPLRQLPLTNLLLLHHRTYIILRKILRGLRNFLPETIVMWRRPSRPFTLMELAFRPCPI